MGKKISIILVAMLCLSMFPWASIGVGSEAKNVKNAEPLKVDAWVESKLAKPGDTIEIYAETSYTEGVSVSADITEIYLGDFDDTEDWLSAGDFNNTQDYLIEQYVATISLTYDSTEEHWVGTYTIPSSAGGVYVADVTATDGVNTATDNATVHLQKFYDEHLKPVQDNAEAFLYGEFNDTIYYIKYQIENFRDVVNNSGGIRGVVENLTGLPEWQALLDASYVYDYEHYYSEYFWEYFPYEHNFLRKEEYFGPENGTYTYNFTVSEEVKNFTLRCKLYSEGAFANTTIMLKDPEGGTYPYLVSVSGVGNATEIHEDIISIPGNWTVNVTSNGTGIFSIIIGRSEYNFTYDITVPDWVDILELSGYCYSYDWEAEVNVTVTLTDIDGNVYTYYLGDGKTYDTIFHPLTGNWTINVATSGNGYFSLSIDGYKYERSKIACFLDNLTKFILSDEYENITSMIPELKSFILDIPEENIIDYLLGFNLTHYLEKMEGAGNIIAAYNVLMGSDEYADFQNALNALQASETYWNQENLSIAIMELFMSDEMMNLLNDTAEYLQGNDTALQNLINSFVAVQSDFNSQLEALMELPEFGDLMGAVRNNTNLLPVYESINTTFNNIKNRVEVMVNSTQLQNLKISIENLQEYMENNVLYEWEHFSEDETFSYNYTVKDWVKELCVDLDSDFDGYWENDTYISGKGNITVTLTDPNGDVYTYTESYNGSGGMVQIPEISEYGKHDYTILFPTPGNWTINVATSSDSGGGGHYDLNIGPKDEVFGSFFVAHMLKESMEELFFVFNAGIAVETEYFQTLGTDGSAKLIAYDANGRIANEEINVIVSRNTGGMLGASSIIPAAILYVWVSGFMSASEATQVTPTISWTQSGGHDNSTVITMQSITPQQSINPDDVIWSLGWDGSSVDGVLSTSGITVDDVTVTWYDNDDNYLLSVSDTINIYKSGETLVGYHFKLVYLPTDSAMLEISSISRSAKDTYEEGGESAGISNPFEALPYIKQMMKEINPGIVYEATVTTDSNGEATINFPVEEFGIYTIDAYFKDENKMGFGESGFIGESFVPEIGLTQIGKFAGIPVYENPNKIGENITFNVNIPEGENASVAIAPMPLNELFPDINMSYKSSDTTITGPDNVSLQVNGPVSLIGVVTGMPEEEEEYESSSSLESFSIPQFNISFGILLTSNVSVSLDVPSILKGERSQLDVYTTGTPVITYGLGYYANGLDIMSLDVTTLSTMVYEGAVYQKEQNITDVMESMKSIICGPGNSAFVTIPKLAVDGEYSFITFTNVDNTDIGVAFTSVNVYAEAGEIPAVTSSGTVDNKDVAVTYVGSGEVIIKSVTITPPAPPANVKHIGIFIEIDTTGTVHDAFITIKYNDSDVAGIDESKLKMYYWNETENKWEPCDNTGVDIENNIVWANVTHFTIFAPMAEKTAAEPAPVSWLIYVGVIGAVMIIVIVSLAVTVKRKKKTLPPNF